MATAPRITGKAAHKMRQFLTAVIGQVDLAITDIQMARPNKQILEHLRIALAEGEKLSEYITSHIMEYGEEEGSK